MKRLTILIATIAAVVPTVSSVVSGQQGVVNAPGMPTLARMVVINGREAAIPVVVQPGGDVQPVTIVGTPEVTLPSDAVVWTRTQRQGWEYRSIQIAAGQDPSSVLDSAGVEGWEAVGVIAGAGNARVLLKRPR